MSADFAKLDASVNKQTWFLLHYWDEDADEIRVELSLPAEMTPDGFVIQWRERIILRGSGDGSAVTQAVRDDSIGPGTDVIDIPVIKKA